MISFCLSPSPEKIITKSVKLILIQLYALLILAHIACGDIPALKKADTYARLSGEDFNANNINYLLCPFA
ncbi:MAG: hypothetical protein UIJ87_07825 [Anaerovoracaceae bacterium]|nr:hypothetical protein [Anaerovoracaceae bacterium]